MHICWCGVPVRRKVLIHRKTLNAVPYVIHRVSSCLVLLIIHFFYLTTSWRSQWVSCSGRRSIMDRQKPSLTPFTCCRWWPQSAEAGKAVSHNIKITPPSQLMPPKCFPRLFCQIFFLILMFQALLMQSLNIPELTMWLAAVTLPADWTSTREQTAGAAANDADALRVRLHNRDAPRGWTDGRAVCPCVQISEIIRHSHMHLHMYKWIKKQRPPVATGWNWMLGLK